MDQTYIFAWRMAYQSLLGKYLNGSNLTLISTEFQMNAIQIKLNFTIILAGYSPLGMVNNGYNFFILSSCHTGIQLSPMEE